MGSLYMDVAFTPSLVRPDWMEMVWVMVDVICTSSTIITLLDRGCPQVFTVRAAAKARALAREKGLLVGGERKGLALPGFDFDNSPASLQNMDLKGKNVVLTTSNGTRAIHRVAASRAVLVGSFLNARACCQSIIKLADKYGTGTGIICAGTEGKFALDDALCAGCLVDTLQHISEEINRDLLLSDSAVAAKNIFQAYPDITSGFMNSSSGLRLLEIQHQEDVSSCSRVNISGTVPILQPGTPYRFKNFI